MGAVPLIKVDIKTGSLRCSDGISVARFDINAYKVNAHIK